MTKAKQDPRVDAYVAKSAAFAQPVLMHLREMIHRGCPGVEEDIKWGRPFFLFKGTILCNISAFKEHCSLGFWGAEMGKVLKEDGALQEGRDGIAGPN